MYVAWAILMVMINEEVGMRLNNVMIKNERLNNVCGTYRGYLFGSAESLLCI